MMQWETQYNQRITNRYLLSSKLVSPRRHCRDKKTNLKTDSTLLAQAMMKTSQVTLSGTYHICQIACRFRRDTGSNPSLPYNIIDAILYS